MKNIEDKLDGFEQVLGILVKKISMMESLLADPKVPVDDLARQMPAEIQASLAKMPSGNLMLSELVGIRKRLDTLSHTLENPKPVLLHFGFRFFLVSLVIMLVTAALSFATVLFLSQDNAGLKKTETKYGLIKKMAPDVTEFVDIMQFKDSEPAIDPLRRIWELTSKKVTEEQVNKRNIR